MSEDKELTPEELKAQLAEKDAQIQRVNAESAERRKELDALKKEKADNLSDIEKLQAESKAGKDAHESLASELQAERIRTAILTKASELGFASPEDAMALLNLADVEVKDGQVTGFEKSLKALAESGRLAMADQKRSDGLGTPLGKGKPADKTEKPSVNFRL